MVNVAMTREEYQFEAISQFKGVVTLLAGFSFASMAILLRKYDSSMLYLLGYACTCLASISLICAATLSSMLCSAIQLDNLEAQPLKWISILLGILGFGGIALTLIAIIILSFTASTVIGIIIFCIVLIFGGVTSMAFFQLNRHFSVNET